MAPGMPRRRFLHQASRGVAGCALAAVVGCDQTGPPLRGRAPGPDWDEHIDRLDRQIPGVMQETAVPGMSVAIIRNATIVWERGYGVRDSETKTPVDSATVFEAASMSKPVFAYAVMKLCEQGVLDLDTPLTRYAREPFLEGDPRLALITARHVLSHTSGFQDIRSGARPLAIHFRPGERWAYSGEGYAYLQAVVTALAGHVDPGDCGTYEAELRVCATDFDEFMTARLLRPCGMTSSGYVGRNAFDGHMARPHDSAGAPLPVRRYTRHGAARYGSMGGLLTTARDYARFLIGILDPPPPDEFRLSQPSLSEMMRRQVAVEEGPDYSVSWGLGWRLAHTARGDLVSHGGDQEGFHCISEMSLAAKSGYVILTNGEDGWKLIRTLAPAMATWIHESRA